MRGRDGFRVSVFCAAILLAALATMGCVGVKGAQYADGIYTGESGEDENGASGEVSLVLKEGRIASCSFVTRQKDGSIKGVDYGKVKGEIANGDFYEKAQNAVKAMDSYARRLVEVQDLRGVDAVSGATVSYGQFVEAVGAALKKAKK